MQKWSLCKNGEIKMIRLYPFCPSFDLFKKHVQLEKRKKSKDVELSSFQDVLEKKRMELSKKISIEIYKNVVILYKFRLLVFLLFYNSFMIIRK